MDAIKFADCLRKTETGAAFIYLEKPTSGLGFCFLRAEPVIAPPRLKMPCYSPVKLSTTKRNRL